ncbi:unnamed protein product [Rotaria sp. Silwood2]|nr:unnamed protein product [Rotaria sp. Silwood2]CAF4585732.1 unnamed protein product [Rotaria sp. Silwood2]
MEAFPTQIFHINTSTYIPISKIKSQSYRLVLLWTSLFNNYYWHQDLFFNLSTIISCSPIHQCQFTRDKRKLSQASLVAFHLYDINRIQLPERKQLKNNNQNWIFITGESPINFYYQNPSFYPQTLDQYFDRSISYKYDSLFSIFSPIVKSQILSKEISNLSLSYKTKIQYERQLNIKSLKSKKKPIAWIVSNCITFSQREKYVENLKKFIQVDIYGKCGISCSKENNDQCNINLDEYYFYLAFENTRCNSYITEKFWNIISDNTHRLVPIVMGANDNDYERIAPKQSYIHVNNYKTPENLAKYLNYLINDPEKYLKYLQWREHTKIESKIPTTWMSLLCPLCQMSYDTQLSIDDRLNFSLWYNPKIECHHNDVKMFTQCKQTNLRVWMNWIHNIKCP